MKSVFVLFLLLVGCADAKPKPIPLPPSPPAIEKVSDSELLAYKAAFLTFKALEAGIVEKYKINAAGGEVFDPDTAVIHRKPASVKPVTVPPSTTPTKK